MLILSELLVTEHRLESFADLVETVRGRAPAERFLRFDVKPPFADTPDNWEDLLEAAFNGVPSDLPSSWRDLSKHTDVTDAELPASVDEALRLLDHARAEMDAGQQDEAANHARVAAKVLLDAQKWEPAVEALRLVYLSEAADAMSALGQGVWLAVTCPIDPELSVAMLQHIVDETPNEADGAAVAAATAHFVADLRAPPEQRAELTHFTGRMLADVARRHSGVASQEEFSEWMVRLELDTPDAFLVRLRNVLDVLVQEDWWFDVEALRARAE